MPNLSDTLGALLKDIAASRVKADLFSRDASLEYFKDPVLRLFPVPRVEIRSADLELTFAVSAARENEVDETQIARVVVEQSAAALRHSLMLVPAKPSRKAEQLESLAAVLQDKRRDVEDEIESKLNTILQTNAATLVKQLTTTPASAVKTIGTSAQRILRTAVKEKRATIAFTSQLQNEVNERVQSWAEAAGQAIREALARAKAEAFAVDLAVTKDELLNVNEKAIARVKVTVEIQNYEWVESEDEDGRSVSKLVAV